MTEARRILTAEGLQNLTMRRLGERLGVAPNALYSHFADKTALVDALLDELLAEVPTAPAFTSRSGSQSWQEQLVALMTASRRFLLAHADLIPLYLSRPGRGPNAIRLGEATLALLARGGVQQEAAVEAMRILLIYTMGFAAQEAPRAADPRPGQRRAASEAAFGGASGAPHMRQLARPLSRHPGDSTFEKGLRWLLAGISSGERD